VTGVRAVSKTQASDSVSREDWGTENPSASSSVAKTYNELSTSETRTYASQYH